MLTSRRTCSEIEDEIRQIQNWPNSHIKDEAHRFYNATLCELRSFNDGYRRHLAHARDFEFTGPDALGLWDQVSRFLHMLGSKISEANYTPKIWV